MCIITFSYQEHPRYKLIIAANRDEFYNRPTKEAHYWEDEPTILAGRDLEAMGTWLGMTRDGRIAALTNYREPLNETEDTISRGEIVKSFLTSREHAFDYLQKLRHNKMNYNGFNVLVGTPDELYYYGNRQEDIVQMEPGTHSISNHLLNTPWPKVNKAKKMLQQYVMAHEQIDVDVLFSQLMNDEIADDELLPNTGVGHKLEQQLSPVFIKTDVYGTRSSTVILVSHENNVTFIERTFNNGSFKRENSFSFKIKSR